ncbi:hypothetical protein [Labilibaculum antarcticum]|uniref:Uncharacterized protein n=1 Tax=Labilibaculum antarcticum TaxID=1717717 RepID=A0A1Y1CL47_9BACT|nr:hypothetical protein [Labilibaculum antarcticum]BAX80001.1 hypothetical protein ALGA_1626 [Labilibaculum antarcticum]
MDYIFILVGLSIAWLFMYKIKWLFGFGVSFLAILIYSILLFGLSFLLIGVNCGNPKMLVFLRMPIVSFVIFRVFYLLFKKIYKRDPENTAWVFEKRSIQDVIFSILFWLLGVALPFFLVI